MRIGMVSKFGEKDGIAIYSDNLVSGLKRKGVEVISIGSLNSVSDYKIDLKSFFLKRHLEKIATKEKLDLIHIQYIAERSYYGMHTLNLNLINALRQKVPVIVTMHEVHSKAITFSEKIVKRLEQEVIGKANLVIIHTSGQKKYISASYKKKAESIPMGVTLHPMRKKKNKKILFFGMISEAKGIEYLIDAMKNLSGYELDIAGRIVSQDYAEKLVVRMKGMNNVRQNFGWVNDGRKHEYFENSSILVLPYVKAPYQSAVLHDAMSYGLPVVLTNCGTIKDIVLEYGCGEVVDPKDGKQLADAIKKVDKDYSKYQKGVERYRKIANWDNVAELTKNSYVKTLRGKRR